MIDPARPSADALVEQARDVLHSVVDPELGLDIVNLGLVYRVAADGEGGIAVEMTLTTPGCPVSESLPAEALSVLSAALPVPVRVDVVWDPPWNPERITPEGAAALGLR